MKYIIRLESDYAVIRLGTEEIVCICNIKRNADLIADILNADNYPHAKYKVVKVEGSDK